MIQLILLVVSLGLFIVLPAMMHRLLVSPRWKVFFGFASLVGTFLAISSLLFVLVVPGSLRSVGLRDFVMQCSRALGAMQRDPISRLPSVLAAAALAALVGRFLWSLLAVRRSTRRATVRGTSTLLRVTSRFSVHLLPVAQPEAYSVGVFRRQVVVSRGLLDLLDYGEASAVLFHEEAHSRGRHQLLLQVARAAYGAVGLLPPSRRALHLFEEGLEERADDYAASRIGDSAVVASSLSKAALAILRPRIGTIGAAGPDVTTRIKRLLDPPDGPRWMASVSVGLGVLTVGFLGLAGTVTGSVALAALRGSSAFVMACPLRM